MHVSYLFESWRKVKSPRKSWGLAWYLAYEFCNRFYASHGIAPHVIQKEGLGYYGIQLNHVHCSVNGVVNESLGRMTIAGDVENWCTGGPGDHGFEASKLCVDETPTSQIVLKAIKHMELPSIPRQTHYGCRHKRWGSSYELLFEIAAIIALRNDDNIQIWNHPYDTKRCIQHLDENVNMKEHPGAFIFSSYGEKRFIVSGDGRILGEPKDNLWNRYMLGESAFSLSLEIENYLSDI